MKHKPKIIILLLIMFVLTQFIGLYVINFYSAENTKIPYGMESSGQLKSSECEINSFSDFIFCSSILAPIIFSFIFAILILFFLTKFDFSIIIKIWFFIVIILALGISFNTFLGNFAYSSLIAGLIAFPLAYIKMYKQNILVHNLTELFIYPGIAAVFVPILNTISVIVLLVLISLYDMWAVWHSGIMQKMAKYQMDTLKVFSGFFMPYLSKKQKQELKKDKNKSKNKKIKVNVAMLGGGDVIFPIITSGVMLRFYGIYPALFVIGGAVFGLSFLFMISEKKKFYPAMPFITGGIFLGLLFSLFLGFF